MSNELQLEDYKLPKLNLGEIFTYTISYEDTDEETKKVSMMTATIKAFFIKVDDLFYLVYIDPEDNSWCYMTEIAGLKYQGKQREGQHPFTYTEALRFLKSRKVIATGDYVVPQVKKKIAVTQNKKKAAARVSSKFDNHTVKYSSYTGGYDKIDEYEYVVDVGNN